jgi:hypothetical protein
LLNIIASGGLISATVSSGGAGYAINDLVYPVQTTGSNGFFVVTAVSSGVIVSVSLASGVVTGVSLLDSGSGYITADSVPTTGGSGTGLTLNITDDESQFSCPYFYGGGPVTGFTLDIGGTGYAVGDTLIPLEPSQSSASGAVLTITEISGTIGNLAFESGGPTVGNYTTGVPTWTTSGSGLGATFVITSVSAGQVTGISVTSGGSGFNPGDLIYITQGSVTGCTLTVASVTNMSAENMTFSSGGPTIYPYTIGAVTSWTTPGSGVGAVFSITSVSSGMVTAASATTAGSGFSIGDLIYITEGSAVGAVLQVATLSGTGVATVTVSVGGLTPYTTGTNIPTTTSGLGTGLTMNITGVTSGAITPTGWSVDAVGSGYAVNDHIYPTEGAATGAIFIVSALSNNSILTVSILTGGLTPYTTGTGVATYSSSIGTGCTLNITGVSSGSILSSGWSLDSGGTGYTVGDKIYPSEGLASGAFFVVTSISSTTGPASQFSITKNGTGYISESGLTTSTSGAGTGALLSLSVADELFFPVTTTSDIPNVYSGGNPISDSRSNSEIVWSGIGSTTIDGSALWINRGASVDNGLVYNWGLLGGTSTPAIVIKNGSAEWAADTYFNRWHFIVVTVAGYKYVQQLITAGTTGSAAPAWNTIPGQKTTDGSAIWLCLSNDSDTIMQWVADSAYTTGHVLEETVGTVSCVFRLQPYTGIMTQGNSFPIYGWQCSSESGNDIGAAGQLPPNTPMAQDGGQTTSSATWSGSVNSLVSYCSGGYANYSTYPVSGNGNLSAYTQVFPGWENLSISMLPNLVIPAEGIYTFKIGHQGAMFWGIGLGTLTVTISSIQVIGGELIVTCNQDITNLINVNTSLTFSGVTSATFLNSQTVTVTSITGEIFTANFSHGNYGPTSDTGEVSSQNTLNPQYVSGPTSWTNTKYNFSTGTPIEGYPIISVNYPSQATSVVVDTVQVYFPSAGIYPSEMQLGIWYHTPSGTYPTVSPAQGTIHPVFYMVYSLPNSSTLYNIIPEGIASSSNTMPVFPSWPTTLSGLQSISPNYPSITEDSGNFTWNNLGPVADFDWPDGTACSLNSFIIDNNANQEIPYAPGISGTSYPTFSITLYGLTSDQGSTASNGLIWMDNGSEGVSPPGTVSTSQGGWKYVVSPVNTLDDTVGNASPASISTGDFFSATGVFISGGLPAVIDPQTDYVAIFRTDDGGATYYLIPPPESGNGNTEYTVPLAQYLLNGFMDNTPDTGLNTLLEAPVDKQNSVPPKGSINLSFHLSRIFVSVGNTVYWSTGPDTPIGNGYNGFSPNNYAEFPSLVTRIVPLNVGTVVFTVSDIYLLTGDGTTGNPIEPEPYLQRIGLISYNALAINGSVVYFMTTDNQVVELHVGVGISGIGQPIANLLGEFSPSESYLTWHAKGFQDQALFVSDGSTGWYKMLTAIPPEVGTPWCPKANIINGAGAVQSIETSPGNIQLLVGPPPEISGPILYRDYNSYQDNGSNYPAYFTFGSIVLAHPGQLASIEFITADSHRFPGAAPLTLGILLGEISGEFEPLTEFVNDPPQLPPSKSLWNQRFYLSQTHESVECRHFQLQVIWPPQPYPDELESLSPYGGFSQES